MSLSKKVAVLVALVLLGSIGWIATSRVEPTSAVETSSRESLHDRELAPPTDAPDGALAADHRSAIAVPAPPPTAATTSPATGAIDLLLRWHDGTPAAGVNARIDTAWLDRDGEFEVVTGEDGTAAIEEVPPGRQTLELDRGFLQTCAVEAGVRTQVDFTIPRGFDISGRVIERGGRTLAGAEILLGDSRGRAVGRSDAKGAFMIRSVRPEYKLVSARAPLHAPCVQRELIGGSANVEDLELVLDPIGGALEGVVYDSDGKPLPHARVLVGDEQRFDQVNFDDGGRGRSPAAQTTTCDENGRYRFVSVAAGRNSVQAKASRHAPWSGEVDVLDQRVAQLDIRLVLGSTVKGRAMDAAGQPVVSALIQGNGNYSFASRNLHTAEDGTFELRDLPAKEFTVTLKAEGFEDASATLLGSPGALLEWNPVLGTGLSIRGRLVLADTDFSGWIVRCESQDKNTTASHRASFNTQVRPEPDGSFEIRGCADVAHQLDIHRPASQFWTFPAARRKDVRPESAQLAIAIDPASLPSCRLRGRIVDDRGEPVPGIEYVLGREGANAAPLLSAEADGTFDIGPLAPGKYSIGVHAAGFAPFGAARVDVAAGATWDFGDLRLSRGGTIAVRLTRAPGLESAGVELYARLPRSGSSANLPVLDDAAHSQVLAPGEYVVELIADRAKEIAQRTRRANVRVGEELALEFHVESGTRIQIAVVPAGNEEAWIEALDSSGSVLWEGTGWQAQDIVLPRQTARLVARDEAGRSAETTIVSMASLRGQVVTLALK